MYIMNTLQSISPGIVDYFSLLNKSLSNFLTSFFPIEKDSRGRVIPQVLIFDQLEELFTFYPNTDKWSEQQEDFFKQIDDALTTIPQLRIVFAIREDFLAQLDPFAPSLPEKLRPRYRLERLQRESAISALVGLLEMWDYQIDKEIIKRS